jgi:hypothetical protein
LADKALEDLHAEWRLARDELRAFEERLRLSFEDVNDKDVRGPYLPLTAEHVGQLQRLVDEERRLADAYRKAKLDKLGRQASDELGLRAKEQAVADDDGMSQADSA